MDLIGPESSCVSDLAPSPNHGERAVGREPDCLILHYTGMESAQAALSWLRNPVSQVSCHYFVWEDGRIAQLVSESRRAWHAGLSSWKGERDINSTSLGIEIANSGHPFGAPPFPKPQIDAVIALSQDLCARYAIAPERVLAHSDVAPARKRDPGEAFPWSALHAAGVGHFIEPHPITGGRGLQRGDRGSRVEALQRLMALYGYGLAPVDVFDEACEQVVTAFQRHFRPQRVDGVADASTLETLKALIGALPRTAGLNEERRSARAS